MVGGSSGPPRIGVLGGVFNPVHCGHLQLGREAARELCLDWVLFMPNGYPPHKPGAELAQPAHRLAMTRLAISGRERFECCDIEMAPPGPHYTVETMNELLRKWPGADFWQIIGADTLPRLAEWRNIEALLTMTRFCVAARAGANVVDTLAGCSPHLAERVTVLEMPPNPVSSSDIRERVRRGHPISGLTPASVCEYIEQHCLYR